jgi:hypothetical protein
MPCCAIAPGAPSTLNTTSNPAANVFIFLPRPIQFVNHKRPAGLFGNRATRRESGSGFRCGYPNAIQSAEECLRRATRSRGRFPGWTNRWIRREFEAALAREGVAGRMGDRFYQPSSDAASEPAQLM